MKPCSRSRHIAFFIHALTVGGAQNRTLAIVNGLVEMGHRVDLIVAAQGAPNENRLDPRIRFIPLVPRTSRAIGSGLNRIADLMSAIPALVRYLNTERPDALIGMANHAAAIAALAHGVMHGPRDTALVLRASNHMTHASAGGSRLRRAHLRPVWRRANHIIAVSRSVAQSLVDGLGIAPERITVLPSPILPDDLTERQQADPGHPWLEPEESGPPVIAGIGRFVRQKGFDVLLEAFALASSQRPCRLLLFGDGPLREPLQARIRQLGLGDRVDLPGITTQPYAVLSRADLFVLPSRWEGMPAVLIEALAAGCPVVATDCPGGVAEVIADGKLGSLVPVDDAPGLARAMVGALAARPDPETLRQAVAPYHTGSAVAAYERWICDFLDSRAAPSPPLLTDAQA